MGTRITRVNLLRYAASVVAYRTRGSSPLGVYSIWALGIFRDFNGFRGTSTASFRPQQAAKVSFHVREEVSALLHSNAFPVDLQLL